MENLDSNEYKQIENKKSSIPTVTNTAKKSLFQSLKEKYIKFKTHLPQSESVKDKLIYLKDHPPTKESLKEALHMMIVNIKNKPQSKEEITTFLQENPWFAVLEEAIDLLPICFITQIPNGIAGRDVRGKDRVPDMDKYQGDELDKLKKINKGISSIVLTSGVIHLIYSMLYLSATYFLFIGDYANAALCTKIGAAMHGIGRVVYKGLMLPIKAIRYADDPIQKAKSIIQSCKDIFNRKGIQDKIGD